MGSAAMRGDVFLGRAWQGGARFMAQSATKGCYRSNRISKKLLTPWPGTGLLVTSLENGQPGHTSAPVLYFPAPERPWQCG